MSEHTNDTDFPLPQTNWALSLPGFEKVKSILLKMRQEQALHTVVEFGTGFSTIRLGMEFPGIHIISFEHEQAFVGEHLDAKKKYCLSVNIDILQRDLTFEHYGPLKLLSYRRNPFVIPNSIDFVLIDGPPFFTIAGREACLYQVYDAIRIGGKIVLDDYDRPREKTVLKHWLAVYPNAFEVTVHNVEHGMVELTKVRSVQPHFNDAPVQAFGKSLENTYARFAQASYIIKSKELSKFPEGCDVSDLTEDDVKWLKSLKDGNRAFNRALEPLGAFLPVNDELHQLIDTMSEAEQLKLVAQAVEKTFVEDDA